MKTIGEVTDSVLQKILQNDNHLPISIYSILFSIITIIFYFPDINSIKEFDYEFIDEVYNNILDNELFMESINKNEALKIHFINARFRLLFPLLIKFTPLTSFSVFVLQFAFLPIFFYVCTLKFKKIFNDLNSSLILNLGFCFLFISNSFVFYVNHYNCYAYFLLICLAATRSSIIKFLIILTLGFIDERALISSIFVLFYDWYSAHDSKISLKMLLQKRTAYPYITGFIAIFCFRFYLSYFHNFNLSTGEGIGIGIFRDNFGFIPIGLLMALEGFWIFMALLLINIKLNKKSIFFLLFVLFFFFQLFLSFIVNDISKSISYSIFSLFLLFQFSMKNFEIETIKKYLFYSTLVSILIPTYLIWGTSFELYWLSPILPKIFKFF